MKVTFKNEAELRAYQKAIVEKTKDLPDPNDRYVNLEVLAEPRLFEVKGEPYLLRSTLHMMHGNRGLNHAPSWNSRFPDNIANFKNYIPCDLNLVSPTNTRNVSKRTDDFLIPFDDAYTMSRHRNKVEALIILDKLKTDFDKQSAKPEEKSIKKDESPWINTFSPYDREVKAVTDQIVSMETQDLTPFPYEVVYEAVEPIGIVDLGNPVDLGLFPDEEVITGCEYTTKSCNANTQEAEEVLNCDKSEQEPETDQESSNEDTQEPEEEVETPQEPTPKAEPEIIDEEVESDDGINEEPIDINSPLEFTLVEGFGEAYLSKDLQNRLGTKKHHTEWCDMAIKGAELEEGSFQLVSLRSETNNPKNPTTESKAYWFSPEACIDICLWSNTPNAKALKKTLSKAIKAKLDEARRTSLTNASPYAMLRGMATTVLGMIDSLERQGQEINLLQIGQARLEDTTQAHTRLLGKTIVYVKETEAELNKKVDNYKADSDIRISEGINLASEVVAEVIGDRVTNKVTKLEGVLGQVDEKVDILAEDLQDQVSDLKGKLDAILKGGAYVVFGATGNSGNVGNSPTSDSSDFSKMSPKGYTSATPDTYFSVTDYAEVYHYKYCTGSVSQAVGKRISFYMDRAGYGSLIRDVPLKEGMILPNGKTIYKVNGYPKAFCDVIFTTEYYDIRERHTKRKKSDRDQPLSPDALVIAPEPIQFKPKSGDGE